jgi:hypothetical protein
MLKTPFHKMLDADGVIRLKPPAKRCTACGRYLLSGDLGHVFTGPSRCVKCSDPRADEPEPKRA